MHIAIVPVDSGVFPWPECRAKREIDVGCQPLLGCGDMGTSKLADHGLACFLLNEHAHILLDRQTMTLGDQHPDSLSFDPASRNFHEVLQHVWPKGAPL